MQKRRNDSGGAAAMGRLTGAAAWISVSDMVIWLFGRLKGGERLQNVQSAVVRTKSWYGEGTRNERSDDGGGSLENNESKVGQFGRFIFGSFGLFELALRKHTFLVHVVPVALDIAFLAYVRRTYEYSEYIISYV